MGITTRFKKSSIVLAFALVGAACGSGSGTADPASETTTTAEVAVETTVTTAVQTTDSVAEAEAKAAESGEWYEGTQSFDSPPAFIADAELAQDQFTDLDAGVYRNTNLGTEVSFEVGDGWATRPNNQPIIVLSSLSNDGPGDMDLVFLRVEGLSDPSQPGADPDEQEGAGTDIQTWLADVIPGIVVGEPLNGSLGGHDATIFNVELSEDVECGQDFCIGFATNRFVESLWFQHNFRYRVYWVEQGAEAPIAVVVGSKSSDEGWFATADEVLETVAFGPVLPNPVGPGDLLAQGFSAEAESTTVELPIAGGIRFDVVEKQFIRQGPGAAFIFGEGPYESDIIAATSDAEGNPIATAEELAAALEAIERIELTFISDAKVAGLDAKVYELTTVGEPNFNNPDIRAREGEGWFGPPEAQVWVMDTPEGPLMITAEVFENRDIFFPMALELANKVIESLEFIG